MNRRRTDSATTAVTCTVAGIQTELKFDFEHQPAEPDAGYMTDGYVIGLMFIQLDDDGEILQAMLDAVGDCITLRIDGRDVPVSVTVKDLTIGHGFWEVRSPSVEIVLAEWLWQEDANEKAKAFNLRDELGAFNRVWLRAYGVGA